MRRPLALLVLCLGTGLQAQSPVELDLQSLRQALAANAAKDPGAQDATPKSGAFLQSEGKEELAARQREDERLEREIKLLKAREKGPARFAADLFDVRQRGTAATEGGVSEDYVLGVGDRLQVNVFGSATFEVPAQVDGRGELVIPKVGTVKVGGRTLAQAKQAVQGLVGRNFSRSTVDLQVVKLREVRVFVMGEVYRPGAFLVSSLSSLVNVLSLAGGPTAVGSFREIRVMRGGKAVFHLDLYPLRAEGLGNPNFALQSGDVVFVPLAGPVVTLEGAFTRVALQVSEATLGPDTLADDKTLLRDRLTREIKTLEAQLALPVEGPVTAAPVDPRTGMEAAPARPQGLKADERKAAEDRLLVLKKQARDLDRTEPGDHRVRLDPRTQRPLKVEGEDGRPAWWRHWEDEGQAPRMTFELKTGETAADALRFAGGLLPEAGEGTLVRRFRKADGAQDAQTLSLAEATRASLLRGDILSALPRREAVGRVVTLQGAVRVPGPFARAEGLRVGDLLKRDQQLLPDTYQARGEILHTRLDGTTRLVAFDVAKAVAGDPAHNLLLEDRDRVELFRVEDLRLSQTVYVSGPLTRSGLFRWHEGMRASDLLFRAGVVRKSANRLEGELARVKEGEASEVRKLDLTKLLSTEADSPVALLDEAVNPLLKPDDQISVYEKPEFRLHRMVRVSGQVAKPGDYALDADRVTLRQVLARAGGATPQGQVRAGIFLRRLERADSSLQRASEESGLTAQDPTAKGVNEILQRLNETKRQPTTGHLLQSPLLHGLTSGTLGRLVVNFEAALKGDASADVELQDGDEIIIPRQTQTAYVVGETASPFGAYQVGSGTKVRDILKLAGGTTRNADTDHIRLLKADGRILDSWISGRAVEPGDTLLVPQRIRRDTTWQENLTALTPIALILNAVK
ncbi:MAG TPA: SLBB domain-containing protein [Holophagaceae bacterium]|nr:SLBB domain-containing protein [Holophagaceae bacterium]